MASRRVAACIVTGFLGSGKTTLLAALLAREPDRERIAVIVNEIGEIGIDGRVLGGFEFVENVIELASGCICCSIDEYRFDLAVDELVRRLDPALLVIETTGVADPAPTIERLRRCGVGVDSVVTVVDATAWRVAWNASRVARRQIECADFLVISKCDLATQPRLGRLKTSLARRNARAKIMEADRSGFFAGAELLLATSAARSASGRATAEAGSEDVPMPGPRGTAPNHHLRDEGIESFSWSLAGCIDRPAFEAALRHLPPAVLRAKGLLRIPGEPHTWLFQYVCGRVELTSLEPGPAIEAGVQAVFIGIGVSAHRDGILATLSGCIAGPPADRAPTSQARPAQAAS